MDSALKEILREEKRRQKDRRSDRSDKQDKNERKDRNDKHERREKHERKDRNDKHERREKHEKHEKERRSRKERRNSEPILPSIEFLDEKQHQEIDDGVERFMFVFEDKNGDIFPKLDLIEKNENDEVKIFPVYVTGYNTNLTEELVIYKEDKWTPQEENVETSWLNVISSTEPNIEILLFEENDIIVYNGKFFHCQNDLFEYIQQNGAEYLSIKI